MSVAGVILLACSESGTKSGVRRGVQTEAPSPPTPTWSLAAPPYRCRRDGVRRHLHGCRRDGVRQHLHGVRPWRRGAEGTATSWSDKRSDTQRNRSDGAGAFASTTGLMHLKRHHLCKRRRPLKGLQLPIRRKYNSFFIEHIETILTEILAPLRALNDVKWKFFF
jgi:hypothetical protein